MQWHRAWPCLSPPPGVKDLDLQCIERKDTAATLPNRNWKWRSPGGPDMTGVLADPIGQDVIPVKALDPATSLAATQLPAQLIALFEEVRPGLLFDHGIR